MICHNYIYIILKSWSNESNETMKKHNFVMTTYYSSNHIDIRKHTSNLTYTISILYLFYLYL